MDDKRAKTLAALSTFIQSQKVLLERTQADIERLQVLRHNVSHAPADACSLETLDQQLNTRGTKLSSGVELAHTVPKDLDWSSFASSDPSPFKTLASNTRKKYAQRQQPSTKQQAPLSSLQQLVKDARATLIDPILASLPPLSSDEEDDPLDPVELRKLEEREKIRELKKHRIDGDSVLRYGLSGLGLRKPAAHGVFVRMDQEDESAEVDIGNTGQASSTVDAPKGKTYWQVPTPSSTVETHMEVDEPESPATSLLSPHPSSMTLEDPASTSPKRSRARRPARKDPPKVSVSKPQPAPQFFPSNASAENGEGSKLDKKGRPRPETYKQAWSVSEQHLLERLLEEIPEGEKNRWSKISKAMGGKRTARQVASRVQKYFEKLKKFGLDAGT